jgi:hypothetical protein
VPQAWEAPLVEIRNSKELEAWLQAAKNAPPTIDGNQAIGLSRKTTGNFVVELLRRAYSLVRGEAAFAWKEGRAGVYRPAGPAAVVGAESIANAYGPAVLSFIAKYADVLKEFVAAAWHNPTLVEIIDWIVRGRP